MALNLRLTGVAARELGVETHVCEVQLLLRPFAELKVRRPVAALGWLAAVRVLAAMSHLGCDSRCHVPVVTPRV